MLFTFKKLRYKFSQSDNFKKYIKYAIGEVILVVIGILLALQVNSCNQQYVNDKKGEVLLKNLKTDLTKQLEDILVQMDFETNQTEKVQNILNQYYADQYYELDTTFFNSSSRLIGRKTFNRNDPTYTAMLSTGSISLIKNEALKNQVIAYYQELEQLENMIKSNNTFFVDQIYKPNILENSFYYNMALGWNKRLVSIAKTRIQKEENELLLANLIAHRAVISQNNLKYLTRLEDKTSTIIEKIQDEIEE